MTDYLTLADVIAIHDDQIARFGGAAGLRDLGALESALFRPQSGYYADIEEEAAALWESLSQNHPFIDGNKRLAFAATYTFLRMNGRQLVADPLTTYDFMIGLYQVNDFTFARLLPWLRAHLKEL